MTTRPRADSTVELDGAPLAYDVTGDGPPLLLIHSALGDRRTWDPQLGPLSERFTVIRVDLRGFGSSPDPVGHYAYHEQVVALLDHLGLDQVDLVGCSFGSYVALCTAVHAPSRVRRLVLVSPIIDDVDPTETVQQFWRDESEALAAGDVERAVDLNIATWIVGPHRAPEQVDAALRSSVAALQADVFAHARAGEERELEPPASERLDAVAVPTLVITGALDERWILDCADRLTAGLPDARPVQLADAAHLPNLESPDDFTDLVVDHLSATSPPR